MAHAQRVKHQFDFWKPDGAFYTCEKADLEAAVAAGGLHDEEIRRRMGHGYRFLAQAFQGLRLDQYQVQHIEYGITPPDLSTGWITPSRP